MSAAPTEKTVADVMMRRPKTLPADVTVAGAQEALGNASVKLLLLVDGDRFVAAVSDVPADADPQAPAVMYGDDEPPTAAADVPISAALEYLEHRPSGRLIVLDDQRTLLGLVCLTTDGQNFCGRDS
jgi:predicted transcriptional regulator